MLPLPPPALWPGTRRALPWLGGLSALAAAAFATLALSAPSTTAPTITALRVGLSPEALPVSTGERDYTSGAFEAVYARELAQRLGATLTVVPLPQDAHAAALRDGTVDLVLGRADPSLDTGSTALPTAYRSGLGVSMRSDTPVRQWADLKDRVVCTSADNLRAQAQAAALGARLQLHAAPAQALVQVRTGDCDAAVLDHLQLNALLSRKEWSKFAAVLPPTEAVALQVRLAPAQAHLAATLRTAMATLDAPALWAQRRQTWASNVAFEVYYDQTGPDCH